MTGKWNKFNWDDVKQKIQDEKSKKGFEKDKRFWKIDKDEKGKYGIKIIRFLPDKSGNPFIKIFNHSFKFTKDGGLKWYIKNCATTIDEKCPICTKNFEFWNSAFEADKDIARKRKRKTKFIANILVVEDTVFPENKGKVFLFEFGTKIYEKIERRLFPNEQDLADPDFIGFVPFDLYKGANLKIKAIIKETGDGDKMPNYDDSDWGPIGALGKEAEIDAIMDQTLDLAEFIAPDKFPLAEEVKSYVGLVLKDSVESTKQDKYVTKETVVKKSKEVDLDNFEGENTAESESSDKEDADFFKNL